MFAKKIRALLLLIIICGTSSGQYLKVTPPDQKYDSYLENKIKNFDRLALPKGLDSLSSLLKVAESRSYYYTGLICNYLSADYGNNGEPDRGVKYGLRALQLYKDNKYDYGVAFVSQNLASNYFQIDQFEKARYYFNEALLHLKASGCKDVAMYITIQNELAKIDLKENKPEVAERRILALLPLADTSSNKHVDRADIFLSLAKITLAQNKPGEAKNFLDSVRVLLGKYPDIDSTDKAYRALYLGTMTDYFIIRSSWQEALNEVNQSIRLDSLEDLFTFELRNLKTKIQILSNIKNSDKALLQTYERLTKLEAKINFQSKIRKLSEFEAQYDIATLQRQNEIRNKLEKSQKDLFRFQAYLGFSCAIILCFLICLLVYRYRKKQRLTEQKIEQTISEKIQLSNSVTEFAIQATETNEKLLTLKSKLNTAIKSDDLESKVIALRNELNVDLNSR